MNYQRPVYRQCAVTHELTLKSDLYKVTRINNEIYFDKYQNMHGRSCYLKKDIKVIELAKKKNVLSKRLKINVNESIYLELMNEMNKERR